MGDAYRFGIYLFKVNKGSTRALCEIVKNKETDVVLVSLLLILKRFHTLYTFHKITWGLSNNPPHHFFP